MTPRTISVKNVFKNKMLNIEAQQEPNSLVNVKEVLKPYVAKGYKLVGYATNVKSGSMVAILKKPDYGKK